MTNMSAVARNGLDEVGSTTASLLSRRKRTILLSWMLACCFVSHWMEGAVVYKYSLLTELVVHFSDFGVGRATVKLLRTKATEGHNQTNLCQFSFSLQMHRTTYPNHS